MDHIGIDLGSRDSQVCVRNSAGAITEEARRPTIELSRWLVERYAHVDDAELARAVRVTHTHADDAATKTATAGKIVAGNSESKTEDKS